MPSCTTGPPPPTEPPFPGCLVHARVIGVFWMHDTKGPDAKLLCVSADDPRFAHLQELGDVPMHQISEIWHFFQIYEALEPDKYSSVRGWEGADVAWQEIRDCRQRFLDTHAG